MGLVWHMKVCLRQWCDHVPPLSLGKGTTNAKSKQHVKVNIMDNGPWKIHCKPGSKDMLQGCEKPIHNGNCAFYFDTGGLAFEILFDVSWQANLAKSLWECLHSLHFPFSIEIFLVTLWACFGAVRPGRNICCMSRRSSTSTRSATNSASLGKAREYSVLEGPGRPTNPVLAKGH